MCILEEDIKSKNPALLLGCTILSYTKDNSSARMYAALNGKITHVHALLFHIIRSLKLVMAWSGSSLKK